MFAMERMSRGIFFIGSRYSEEGRRSDEAPHDVAIMQRFAIGICPVTQREWLSIMGRNPSTHIGNHRLPVETVSWYDAIVFCNALSLRNNLTPPYHLNGNAATWNRDANGFRLPTEAEWEMAAREGASSHLRFLTGHAIRTLQQVAWFDQNSKNSPHLAGSRHASAAGLYDMLGNVWEWCWDWYGPYDTDPYATDPSGPTNGIQRVVRGGAFDSPWQECRVATRHALSPSQAFLNVGFRLARNA